MNKYLETAREIIKRNKKKIVKRISILLVLGVAVCGIGAITVYSIAKSNINYTVDEAKVIALQAVQGDILKVRKSLELDNLSFEYKFKIKNSLRLSDVSAKHFMSPTIYPCYRYGYIRCSKRKRLENPTLIKKLF